MNADRAKRVWTYTKDTWEWPHWWSLIYRGGDEYGNRTLVVRLPIRNMVVVTNLRLRREELWH